MTAQSISDCNPQERVLPDQPHLEKAERQDMKKPYDLGEHSLAQSSPSHRVEWFCVGNQSSLF